MVTDSQAAGIGRVSIEQFPAQWMNLIEGRFTSDWLRLVAFADLTNPVSVSAVREAAEAGPAYWEMVAPSVKSLLFMSTVKIESLGGTLDDLLAMLLDSLDLLAHPRNRNFARQTSALEQVELSLDFRLQQRLDADAERGRRNLESVRAAGRAKGKKARKKSKATKWLKEVDERRVAETKEQIYRRIEKHERLRPGSAKKAVIRARKALTRAAYARKKKRIASQKKQGT